MQRSRSRMETDGGLSFIFINLSIRTCENFASSKMELFDILIVSSALHTTVRTHLEVKHYILGTC